MADIFISYSKAFRSLTEDLARDLERAGYSVWWDTELVGGDEFKNVILKELDGAQAVIVIWTPASVTSNWVYSEANRALAQKKLITVKSADTDFRKIPPPFDTLHFDPLEARERIFVALGKLGVEAGRGGQPFNAADEALWEEVLSLKDPRLFIHYLKTFPFGAHAHQADAVIWRGVAAQNVASGYLWYLKEFPGGLYSTEAEDAYWAIQSSLNSFEAYADYLKNRPRGRYQGEADARLWDIAASENTIESYQRYRNASYRGIKVDVAKLRAERLHEENARREKAEREERDQQKRQEEERRRRKEQELQQKQRAEEERRDSQNSSILRSVIRSERDVFSIVAFSCDGRHAFSGSDRGVGGVYVWDITTGEAIRSHSISRMSNFSSITKSFIRMIETSHSFMGDDSKYDRIDQDFYIQDLYSDIKNKINISGIFIFDMIGEMVACAKSNSIYLFKLSDTKSYHFPKKRINHR